MNRETIFSTLFTNGSNAANFTTKYRRLHAQGDPSPEEMPMFCQIQGDQTVTTGKGLPKKYTLSAEWWVYAYSDDLQAAPSSILNPLVDALEATLAPAPGTDTQNLGIAGVEN